MGTTNEHLKALESGLGLVQNKLQNLSISTNNKFLGMETKYQTMETSTNWSLETSMQGRSWITRGHKQQQKRGPCLYLPLWNIYTLSHISISLLHFKTYITPHTLFLNFLFIS